MWWLTEKSFNNFIVFPGEKKCKCLKKIKCFRVNGFNWNKSVETWPLTPSTGYGHSAAISYGHESPPPIPITTSTSSCLIWQIFKGHKRRKKVNQYHFRQDKHVIIFIIPFYRQIHLAKVWGGGGGPRTPAHSSFAHNVHFAAAQRLLCSEQQIQLVGQCVHHKAAVSSILLLFPGSRPTPPPP